MKTIDPGLEQALHGVVEFREDGGRGLGHERRIFLDELIVIGGGRLLQLVRPRRNRSAATSMSTARPPSALPLIAFLKSSENFVAAVANPSRAMAKAII